MHEKLWPFLYPYLEISFKWIIGLYVNAKIIELLGENIDENLCNTRARQWFLYKVQKGHISNEKKWLNELIEI